MKLRYYLRGLGIGIIVTAIIMSFTRQPQELTDAQIKAKARELGMVEENVLADLKKDDMAAQDEAEVKESEKAEVPEESVEAEISPEEVTEESTGNEEVVTETIDIENNSDENDGETVLENENNKEDIDVTEETGSETKENEVEMAVDKVEEPAEKYVVISINGGNGSEIVSKRLYEAGLVSSEIEYNRFLVKNGYDRKLRVGNHEIPVGATEEEIAKILCGKN